MSVRDVATGGHHDVSTTPDGRSTVRPRLLNPPGGAAEGGLAGTEADRHDALGRVFLRLCPPARRLLLSDVAPGRCVALVAFDEEGLMRWASASQVPGRTFDEVTSGMDLYGYVTACLTAADSHVEGLGVDRFAIIDRPVGPAEATTEVLRDYAELVDQLART